MINYCNAQAKCVHRENLCSDSKLILSFWMDIYSLGKQCRLRSDCMLLEGQYLHCLHMVEFSLLCLVDKCMSLAY